MTEISEALVTRVLDDFYAKVRRDPILGPVFSTIIGEDWTAHMEKIRRFWCSALRIRPGYEGRAFMPAHLRHDSIQASQMDRWMELFRETVAEDVDETQRAAFLRVAVSMSENLAISLARRDGGIAPH